MELFKLGEIRQQLIEDEASLTESKKVLLKELNYLYEQGILPKN